MATKLRALGLAVECMDDHFLPDVEDAAWIREVGRRGWIILSKDMRLQTNTLEVIALLQSGTFAFLLKAAGVTGDQTADSFQKALPQIIEIVQRHSPPLVATVTKGGKVNIKYTHDDLIDKASSPNT